MNINLQFSFIIFFDFYLDDLTIEKEPAFTEYDAEVSAHVPENVPSITPPTAPYFVICT